MPLELDLLLRLVSLSLIGSRDEAAATTVQGKASTPIQGCSSLRQVCLPLHQTPVGDPSASAQKVAVVSQEQRLCAAGWSAGGGSG